MVVAHRFDPSEITRWFFKGCAGYRKKLRGERRNYGAGLFYNQNQKWQCHQ